IRQARALPRHVSLPDGDRVALIDFDSVVSLEAAAALLARERECTLQEVFAPPERACVRGEGCGFAHELIIPFVAPEASEPPTEGAVARPPGEGGFRQTEPDLRPRAGARACPPGSEWLYARLEAAGSLHDRLLAEIVAPVVRDGRSSGAIDTWFFVRFADPAP